MSRILVIKLSSLGDLFHALPAVHAIKQGTGASIDWVTQPEYVDLVQCFADIDRVIAFPRRALATGLPSFLSDLRRDAYDFVLDLQGLLKSAAVARLARTKRRIGPSFNREGSRLLYDEVAGPTNKDRHAVDEVLDVVRHLNLPAAEPVFPVRFPKKELDAQRPHVAFLPRSRWPTKNWPVAHFVAVGRALQKQKQATIYLFGTPADAVACSRIERQLEGFAVNLCGQTSLMELGSHLQEMDLAVSVDSGPMHVAAAVGVPVLALFGPTDPKRTGPYGAKHRVLTHVKLACRPCFSEKCLLPGKEILCLTGLAPDRAIEAALAMM
ncbi:MAG: glycosyltransferase family 9 protein [bacterium]